MNLGLVLQFLDGSDSQQKLQKSLFTTLNMHFCSPLQHAFGLKNTVNNDLCLN
jgi:hypothetical protein